MCARLFFLTKIYICCFSENIDFLQRFNRFSVEQRFTIIISLINTSVMIFYRGNALSPYIFVKMNFGWLDLDISILFVFIISFVTNYL